MSILPEFYAMSAKIARVENKANKAGGRLRAKFVRRALKLMDVRHEFINVSLGGQWTTKI